MTLVNISRLREIAEVEFGEIVVDTDSPDLNELRIILIMAALSTYGFP